MMREQQQPIRAWERGITLIEVLAALAVTALVLGLTTGALRMLGRAADRGSTAVNELEMASRGIDALRRDIERMERVAGRGERRGEYLFVGDQRQLVFAVVEPPYPSEAGPYFLSYTAQGGFEHGALVRSRAIFDPGAKSLRQLPVESDVVVLEGPYRLAFSFLEEREGQTRWVPRWLSRDRLPSLIRLEMTGTGSGLTRFPPLIFRPRQDAEIGCVKEAGVGCSAQTRGVLQPDRAGAEGQRQ